MKPAHSWFAFAAVMLIAFLVTFLAAPFSWTVPLLLAIQSALPHQILPVVAVLLLAALLSRHRTVVITSILTLFVVMLNVHTHPGVKSAYAQEHACGQVTLQVFAANLLDFNPDQSAALGPMFDLLDPAVPAVLVTAETRQGVIEALQHAGWSRLQVGEGERHADSVTLWSSPATDAHPAGVLTVGERKAPAARVVTEDVEVLVVGVHLTSPQDRSATRSRDRELRDLAEHLAGLSQQEHVEVVVAGDFNTSAQHRAFRPVLEHARITSGAGASWPADRWHPPLLDIDHIVTFGRQRVCAGGMFPVPGSDHNGVLTVLGRAAAFR